METEVTTENFEAEVINSDKPVLVDFWAPWCGPCKTIAPHVASIANDYQGKVKVCKINIDDSGSIATRFTVMSIPTVMLFKEGKIMEKRVGAIAKAELEKLIQPYIT
ncbi:MAG: thioredoxin [Candidatus Omnitrophica bacterium]|nr:thioredoxin [Candidatus Omnitrophota bacterium]